MALSTSGIVMNGPTPIMSIMLSAVAVPRPIPRIRPGELEALCSGSDMMEGSRHGYGSSRILPLTWRCSKAACAWAASAKGYVR